jgi:hypothetical protein
MIFIIFTLFTYLRDLEHKVIDAAARIGKIKPSHLVVKVRSAIAKSEFPGGLTHMRSIAAIRQEYYRYIINFNVQVAFYFEAVLIIKALWKE